VIKAWQYWATTMIGGVRMSNANESWVESLDGHNPAFGRGVLVMAGELPVAISAAWYAGSSERQVLVADCVRQPAKVLRLPADWQHPVDSALITNEAFGDRWLIRRLERTDASWLSDLKIDDLPIASLEALITTIVEMENMSEGGPYFYEEGWEPDFVYLESDGALRHEVQLSQGVLVERSWRIAGQWVLETDITAPKEIRLPIRPSYVHMIVKFIDEGLLPTPDILRLVNVSSSGEVELNETRFMGEDGVPQSGFTVFMPMEHYLDSELNGIRMKANGSS